MRSFITPAALFVNVTARMALAGHAFFDQMRHAVRDHARLARSGARENEQRSFGGLHRFPLTFVESEEEWRSWEELIKPESS